MSKKENLQVIVMQYVNSILGMVDNISPKNINQIMSLIKANIKVLEDDVRNSFTKHNPHDFNYRDIN